MYPVVIAVGLVVALIVRVVLIIFRRKKGEDTLKNAEFILFCVLGILHAFFITGPIVMWLAVSILIVLFGLFFSNPKVREWLSEWLVIILGPAVFMLVFLLGNWFVTPMFGYSYLPVFVLGYLMFYRRMGKFWMRFLSFVLMFAVFVGGASLGWAENTHQEWAGNRYMAEAFEEEAELWDVEYGFRGQELALEYGLDGSYEEIGLIYLNGKFDDYYLKDF